MCGRNAWQHSAGTGWSKDRRSGGAWLVLSRYTAYSAGAPRAVVDIRWAHGRHSAGAQGVASRCPAATWQQADRLSRPLVGIPQADTGL